MRVSKRSNRKGFDLWKSCVEFGRRTTPNLVTSDPAKESCGTVIELGFAVTGSWVAGTITGALHVRQELSIAFKAIAAVRIAGIVRRTGRTEIGTVKALWNHVITAPRVSRSTGTPGRAIRLGRSTVGQTND